MARSVAMCVLVVVLTGILATLPQVRDEQQRSRPLRCNPC